MATDKLFTVVGIACKKGTYKVRWANDLISRVKMLTRDEQTDIRLVQLSEPMSKYDAVQQLVNHIDFQDDNAQQAIDDFLYSSGVQAKPQKVKQVEQTTEEMYAEVFGELLEEELV